MDGIGVVLSLLAMFVALAGVFFSSSAMKKIDEANTAFVKSHLDPLAAELAELKNVVNKTRRLAEQHQSEFTAIKDTRQDLATAFRDIEIRLQSLKANEEAPRKTARSSGHVW